MNISPFSLTLSMRQYPLSILSNLLFTSITIACIGRFVPDRRSPKKSYNDENPVHQFKDMESDDMNTNALTWVMACFFIKFLNELINFEYQVTV